MGGVQAVKTASVHRALAIAAAILGLAAAGADGFGAASVRELALDIKAERDHISAPELADRIIARDSRLQVLDLRPRPEYDAFHIPTASPIALDELTATPLPRSVSIVLYSEGGVHAAQAWMLLKMRGYRDVRFLREGIYEWLSRVMEPRLAEDATPVERADFERAAEQSRFFGGQPRSGVPRTEVPEGYWTAGASTANGMPPAGAAPSAQTIARIRRRGC